MIHVKELAFSGAAGYIQAAKLMMDSAAAPPIEACPNCSTPLLGSHCHKCGQKKIDANEYSLKRFVGRAINDFTDLESNKVFRTLSAMIVRPGLLAAEYLAGRRGSYLGPLKLYLTFSALYFLFAWTVLSEVRGGSAQRLHGIRRPWAWRSKEAWIQTISLARFRRRRRSMRAG